MIYNTHTNKKLHFFAFTLAEVLITLGIIGVVAAITIPTLMNNTNNTEFKSKLKKEYSVLAQAYLLIATENGGSFKSAVSQCSALDSTCLKNLFKTKLIYIKECDGSIPNGQCFTAQANIKRLNNSSANMWYINSSTSSIVMADGASILFQLDSSDCSTPLNESSDECGWITLDVNGLKSPNTWGKDIFVFSIRENQLSAGSYNTLQTVITGDDCNTGTNYGYTCASKLMFD